MSWSTLVQGCPEGNLPAAFEDASNAENEFQADGRTDREAAVHMLLALALLAHQNPAKAQTEVEMAQQLSAKNENAITRLELAITAARVQAAMGKTSEAMKDLEAPRKRAARAGLRGIELEARLALGEIALASRHSPSARAALAALQKDAQARALGLIARKAATAANR